MMYWSNEDFMDKEAIELVSFYSLLIDIVESKFLHFYFQPSRTELS